MTGKDMHAVIAFLRQSIVPVEFRIAEPDTPQEGEQPLAPEEAPLETSLAGLAATQLRMLIEISNAVWRLRRRMFDRETAEAKQEFRREAYHLETIWQALTDGGIKILDHDGEPFDAGRSMKVATWVPTEGVTRSHIQETILPTIYYCGRHVQQAQVIVETPAALETPAADAVETPAAEAAGTDATGRMKAEDGLEPSLKEPAAGENSNAAAVPDIIPEKS